MYLWSEKECYNNFLRILLKFINSIHKGFTKENYISSYLNWNPDTMYKKGFWNDQIHNDNTTRVTKYKFMLV
jgi:hypothetical protein